MARRLWQKTGLVRAAVMAAALILTMAAPGIAAAQGAQSGPATWTVLVGGQSSDGTWQFMRFYPNTITVNAGDTVVWKLNSMEPHTVTFGNPQDQSLALVVPEGGSSQRLLFNPKVIMPQGSKTYDGSALTGSGQLEQGGQFPTDYKLTFTNPGTYTYFCAFHGMMTGKVIVQAAGTAYPKTQAQIDADAKAQLNADIAAGNKANPQAAAARTQPGQNGATTHVVNIGYGDGMMSWMGYAPGHLTIKAGDSVQWVQQDPGAPHTVTFASGGEEPQMVLAEPQGNGPPKLVINPQALNPAGGPTYAGKGYFNSGFIWGTKMPQPGPRNYTLTFTTPGTYEYYCILHDNMGMKGTIVVTGPAAGSSGQAPNTLPVTGGGPGWPIALMALLGAGLLATGVTAGRRRAA